MTVSSPLGRKYPDDRFTAEKKKRFNLVAVWIFAGHKISLNPIHLQYIKGQLGSIVQQAIVFGPLTE